MSINGATPSDILCRAVAWLGVRPSTCRLGTRSNVARGSRRTRLREPGKGTTRRCFACRRPSATRESTHGSLRGCIWGAWHSSCVISVGRRPGIARSLELSAENGQCWPPHTVCRTSAAPAWWRMSRVPWNSGHPRLAPRTAPRCLSRGEGLKGTVRRRSASANRTHLDASDGGDLSGGSCWPPWRSSGSIPTWALDHLLCRGQHGRPTGRGSPLGSTPGRRRAQEAAVPPKFSAGRWWAAATRRTMRG